MKQIKKTSELKQDNDLMELIYKEIDSVGKKF